MSKIKHEHARERLDDLLNGNVINDKVDNEVLLGDYINQQEKQDKLLELYKELSKLKDDVIRLVFFETDYEHLRVKTVEIEQQIKELENNAK